MTTSKRTITIAAACVGLRRPAGHTGQSSRECEGHMPLGVA